MKRTPLTSSSILIIGLILLSCLLTPSLADEASNNGTSSMLPPELTDTVAETGDSHNNIYNISTSTLAPSSFVPTNVPSSSDPPPSSNNDEEDDAYGPRVKNQEYEISTSNKFIVFVFGAAVIISVLLLIKNNREHSAQLAQLRREQQERREMDQSRRQGALEDRRKKKFLQQFHFTVISNDGSNAFEAGSNVLSAKQGHPVTVLATADVEAQSPPPSSTEKSSDDNGVKGQEEGRPSITATTSNHNNFFHFWKKHQEQGSANECSICLGDYCPGDTICVAKAAKCNHVFHQDCIAEWLKKSDCCPLCRVDLMTAAATNTTTSD